MSIKTLAALAALLAAAPLAAQTPITPGETVTGTLQEGDRQMDDGAYYDAYVIRGRPGERVVVRMTSDDFDTYLHWGVERGGEWVEEDENDDTGDGTDSRLVIRLESDGAYELRAAGFDEDEEGEYTLRVSPFGEPRAARLRVGDTADGELTEEDHEGEEGYEDHYVIRGAPGTQATITAESDDFDTYLQFGVWEDGELEVEEENDDGAGGTNSQLLAEFDEGGEYRLVVRGFAGEGTGAYRLRVEEGDHTDDSDDEEWSDEEDPDDQDSGDSDDEEWSDDEDADGEDSDDSGDEEWSDDEDSGDEEGEDGEEWPATDSVADYSQAGRTAVRVTPAETVEGALGEANPQDEDGGYYQEFIFRGTAGERLRVRVSSADVDPYVLLGTGTHGEFEAIAEDDDSGPELDAELDWTVPESGEYTIRVTTASPGQTGPFVLRLRTTR